MGVQLPPRAPIIIIVVWQTKFATEINEIGAYAIFKMKMAYAPL